MLNHISIRKNSQRVQIQFLIKNRVQFKKTTFKNKQKQ
ncbi:uncharacterized protein MP3633_0610 [Marinomonas primoryensis]|uniref:Uncharacterized protein n=1 Tax=Marinomonas primoryensis TaxID=178399 RepID=A0A859CT96_9GAMM|nr:uncharacterized protein MP3633_0610 [Marinomonas primoryensis]